MSDKSICLSLKACIKSEQVDTSLEVHWLRTPYFQCRRCDFKSLVGELRSHMLCSAALPRLKEGDIVDVLSDTSTETVLSAEIPTKVVLQVTYTEPGLKGDTATNTLKPATVETGAEVRVPLFINEGELIEIDTRDGSYVGRVKA